MLSRILLLLAILAVLAASTTTNAKPTKQRSGVAPGGGGGSHYKHAAAKNPTQTFCKTFNAQCYLSAVQKKQSSGGNGKEVHVVHACRRNGGKYSKSFAFGCRADGVDITQSVLDRIGGGYTVTTTATAQATVTSSVSITATAPTATITSVSTSTAVSTSYTSTAAQVFLGSDAVPIVIVSVPNTPSPRRKRADHIDAGQFCSAFSAGCIKECARVSSIPKHTVCQAGAEGDLSTQYKLACYCKNHKVETQHALRDTTNQEHVATVSTVATSTSLFTVTAATSTPKTTTATTTTTTATTKLTSTTVIVLAATGAVQIINGPDSSSLGYLSKQPAYNQIYQVDVNKANAQSFFAVRDSQSGLYSLQQADASGTVALVEQFNNGAMGAGSSVYGALEAGTSTACGSSSLHAGPPDGSGPNYGGKCEVFVFGAQADAQSLTAGGTLDMTMYWVNPGESTAKQYVWTYDNLAEIFSTGDVAQFQSDFNNGYAIRQVTLRFPVALP